MQEKSLEEILKEILKIDIDISFYINGNGEKRIHYKFCNCTAGTYKTLLATLNNELNKKITELANTNENKILLEEIIVEILKRLPDIEGDLMNNAVYNIIEEDYNPTYEGYYSYKVAFEEEGETPLSEEDYKKQIMYDLMVKNNVMSFMKLRQRYGRNIVKKIREKISNNNTRDTKESDKLKYGHIFAPNGYIIFKHIMDNYIKPKGDSGHINDVLYFHLKLYNDKYIHQRATPFLNWYNETFEDDIIQTKTLNEIKNTNRDNHYKNAIEWLKKTI